TSRSICSNASSTRFSTCFLSLCRCFSFPRCFIQGFSWVVVFNFSWIASVTSWRRGIPRWAAADFARRNKKSGVSRVVFTHPYYHIYGKHCEDARCQPNTEIEILRKKPLRISAEGSRAQRTRAHAF